MLFRHSPETGPNRDLRDTVARSAVTNLRWLAQRELRYGILLVGGTSIVDFRLRVAQSHMRSDLLPSFWSMAALINGDGRTITCARIDRIRDSAAIPGRNGVQVCPLSDYDDPQVYPNIAVLRFGGDRKKLESAIERVSRQRGIVDIVSLMVQWLGFVWGTGQQGNPLIQGTGMPSASLVEAVYSLAGVELTPGLATSSTCPEAIWQSAKWWRSYYDQPKTRKTVSKSEAPAGTFLIRQRAAAVVEESRPGRSWPSGSRRSTRRKKR